MNVPGINIIYFLTNYSIYGTMNSLQQEVERLKDDLLRKEEYIHSLNDRFTRERSHNEDADFKLYSLTESFNNIKTLYDSLHLDYNQIQDDKNALLDAVDQLVTDKEEISRLYENHKAESEIQVITLSSDYLFYIV